MEILIPGTILINKKNMNDLIQIAIDYHYNTESYDRLVCYGVSDRDGGAMPRTEEENRKVQSNAFAELGYAVRKAEKIGFKKSDLMRAISDVMINNIFNFEREKEIRNKNIPKIK